jgi:ketosteroid isomerase-like protein
MSTKTIGTDVNVRRLYELIDAGDIPAMLELFTEDATYRRPGYDPLVGRDELERFYRHERIISEGVHTPELVLVNGEHIAVHGRFRGMLKSGNSVEIEYAEFFTVTPEGRFATRETYFFAPLV